MMRRCAAVFLAAVLPAQAADLAAAEQELLHVFDRPPGTAIGQAQKDRLAAFLQRYAGQDLQHLGYARALQLYLDRDYDGAVAALDEFFARQPAIRAADHRTIGSRIYLNAIARECRQGKADLDKLGRWGERMVRLDGDTAALARVAESLLPRMPDAAAFRVTLARGVLASGLPAAQQDGFLRSLYGAGGVPAAGARALPVRALRGVGAAAAPVDPAKVVQPGQTVEPFEVDQVVNASAFDLSKQRGKVVVLDFFATWCGPCRGALPAMVALQKAHPDDLQVVGVTRFYGRGMEFQAGAAVPDGGKPVTGLDREREIAVNESCARAFGIGYPILFVGEQLMRERFGVTAIPTVLVIGRDGRLVGRVTGGGEDEHKQLLELVEQARR